MAAGPRWLPVDDETGQPLPLSVIVLTLAVAAQFLSGRSEGFGFPVPPERVLLAAGAVLFLVEWRHLRWRPQPIHLLMVAMIGWCVALLVWFGAPDRATAVFQIADAVGIVPFLLFAVAPVLFATRLRRQVLLLVLTALGGYLGVVALLEGLGMQQFVWPRYIDNPSSAHYGRAMGPSLQVANNGLQMTGCGLAAALLASVSRTRAVKAVCIIIAGLCFLGTFFTMTRSVWLGVLIGLGAAMAYHPRLRRFLPLAAVGLAAVVTAVLAYVEPVRESTMDRVTEQRSTIDRIMANETAVRIVMARPILGIGLQNFPSQQDAWMWQPDTLPVAATGISVHNVFLGYAAELGLTGAGLWTSCLVLAIVGAALSRAPRGEHLAWRSAALGYAVCWVVVGNLVPITYAMPASLLWLFLGIVTDPERLGFAPPRAQPVHPVGRHRARREPVPPPGPALPVR